MASSDPPPNKDITAASQEAHAPADAPAAAGSNSHNHTGLRDAPSTATTKKLQSKRAPTPSTSAANSPLPSRESSPVRPALNKPTSTTASRSAGPGRSRKNSAHDVSPSRPSSTHANPPSAAATQRALSAASIPTLHPANSESTIRAPIPQKASVTTELKDAPRWPVSPRLRSPPPVNIKPSITSPRKVEPESPAINVQRPSHTAERQEGKQGQSNADSEETLLMPGTRTPARGPSGGSTLETVQEISQPNTPGRFDGAHTSAEDATTQPTSDNGSQASSTSTIKGKSSLAATNESGSDSGGKGEVKMRSKTAPSVTGARPSASKPYSASAGAGRGKPSGEVPNKTMTVEAETVSSVPQVNVGAPGNTGTVRAKPSSETIRPKKDKKKTSRKTPSVTSNTASSKADIFEAKVASAVDEADSSDSEETFVYESNPPDISDAPKRYHSRTPSATSMASQIDHRKSRAGLDGGHSVAMKKSMKFANSSHHSTGPDTTTGEDDGKGTARSSVGTGRGTTQHHHIGRWGRHGGGNGHASLFDNESPFPNAAKSKFSGTRQSSRPTSPRFSQSRPAGNGKKSPLLAGYDLDDGADDERTPLITSVRSARSNRRRHGGSSLRQLEHQAMRNNRSFFARFAGCLVLSLMIILVILGAVAFMFATTQPLVDVKVMALKNVLASEQDVILDMLVEARNPNIVAVVVDQADLFLFAKSKYAGTNSEWWTDHPDKFTMRRGLRSLGWPWEGDEDDDDKDPSTNPNLEIGHVYELDSPLTFEGSPFQHTLSQSLGQIRIDQPGNATTPKGSERWGRVLQHEFELLVRGTLKYTLPLSQRVRSISVEGRVTVKPNAADQDPNSVHIIQSLESLASNDSD